VKEDGLRLTSVLCEHHEAFFNKGGVDNAVLFALQLRLGQDEFINKATR